MTLTPELLKEAAVFLNELGFGAKHDPASTASTSARKSGSTRTDGMVAVFIT
jgi:hypothetical protein